MANPHYFASLLYFAILFSLGAAVIFDALHKREPEFVCPVGPEWEQIGKEACWDGQNILLPDGRPH